jgi:hypothetical protein
MAIEFRCQEEFIIVTAMPDICGATICNWRSSPDAFQQLTTELP